MLIALILLNAGFVLFFEICRNRFYQSEKYFYQICLQHKNEGAHLREADIFESISDDFKKVLFTSEGITLMKFS